MLTVAPMPKRKTVTKRARSSVDWGALAPMIATEAVQVLRDRMQADAAERMALISVMQRMADALKDREPEKPPT